MKMIRIFAIFVVCLVAQIGVSAQATQFSSVYTTFTKDCRAEVKVVADEVPFICKAVGAFRARIVPAGAWAEQLEIVNAAGTSVASLGTHGYGYTTDPKRVLEWRLANGKPFAVIFRVAEYNSTAAEETGENPYLLKFKTGEKLLVRGVEGYEGIEFEVDGRLKDANLKARKMADENYK